MRVRTYVRAGVPIEVHFGTGGVGALAGRFRLFCEEAQPTRQSSAILQLLALGAVLRLLA
jgi:hypothetical protein